MFITGDCLEHSLSFLLVPRTDIDSCWDLAVKSLVNGLGLAQLRSMVIHLSARKQHGIADLHIAPQFFAMVGVASNVGLLTTAVFGVVKFIAAISCALCKRPHPRHNPIH